MTVPDGSAVVFDTRLMNQDQRWASDSILHEMIHLELLRSSGDGDRDHAESFVTLANRIGDGLGWAPVGARSRQALDWPQSAQQAPYPPWRGGACPLVWVAGQRYFRPGEYVLLNGDQATVYGIAFGPLHDGGVPSYIVTPIVMLAGNPRDRQVPASDLEPYST